MEPDLVIVNPVSGPGRRDADARARRRVAIVGEVLAALGRDARVEVTRHAGHARELAAAAAAAGVARVIAWGGDGTVNEVGSALAFGVTALGVVPGGSGNGFGRALGISLRPAAALRQAFTGPVHRIDAGEIAGRLFFNVAGIGFDAHVVRIYNRGNHRRGFARYLGTSFVELFRYRPQRYVIETPGAVIDRRALMVVFANGAQYGNGARIAPDARLDDGLLDLVVVDSHSPWRNVLRSRYLFDGSIARRPGVLLARVDRASIADDGEAELVCHVDGESLICRGPLAVRLHGAALNVVMPGDAGGWPGATNRPMQGRRMVASHREQDHELSELVFNTRRR